MVKKVISISILFALFFLSLWSCNARTTTDSTAIVSDSALISKGRNLFTKHCSSCHNFRQDGIGPQLGGLTTQVSIDWIKGFIRDPRKMVDTGDGRSKRLFDKYKVLMPSFAALTDDEMNCIIAFLGTQGAPNRGPDLTDRALANPVVEPIRVSDVVASLELLADMPSSTVNGRRPIARITKLDFRPKVNDLFIVDLRGRLYRLDNNKPHVYLDIAKLRPEFICEPGHGTGFGSFAFHPEFQKNGLLYTTHAEKAGAGKADFSYPDSIQVALQWVLTEWKSEDPLAGAFSGNSRELLRIDMVSAMHGVQEIAFNTLARRGDPDYGLLYVAIGDGGCVDYGYPFLTHGKDKAWGSIFRIDPLGNSSVNGRYGIPSDNPFAKDGDGRIVREIYAYGFRNPHRITWSKKRQMLASNIGGSNIESINLVMPGNDYGWPIREGTFVLQPYGNLSKVYSLPPDDSLYHITYPVAQYDHEGGWTAISGGFEYWGSNIPELSGKFIFGDIASGRLFFIEMRDVQPGQQTPIMEWRLQLNGNYVTLRDLCEIDLAERVDLHFGRDSSGELYILTKTDGKVYKLVRTRTTY